jgi:hypothetical protein
MAEVLILEFSTEEALDLYNKVNGHMGLDSSTGSGDWPNGLLSHVAGLDANELVVVQVWESKGDHEQFMNNRLGPALQAQNAHRRAESHGSPKSAIGGGADCPPIDPPRQ